jgi:hypothetical protein
MTKKKLTPWYPARIKPVREGVYMIKQPNPLDRVFAAWCGDKCGWTPETRIFWQAEDMRGRVKRGWQRPSVAQYKVWCGLAQEP